MSALCCAPYFILKKLISYHVKAALDCTTVHRVGVDSELICMKIMKNENISHHLYCIIKRVFFLFVNFNNFILKKSEPRVI